MPPHFSPGRNMGRVTSFSGTTKCFGNEVVTLSTMQARC